MPYKGRQYLTTPNLGREQSKNLSSLIIAMGCKVIARMPLKRQLISPHTAIQMSKSALEEGIVQLILDEFR